MTAEESAPWGYRWRSSQSFIISTATISLFSETFLFGFVVPILPYMLERRLHVDPALTQSLTTTLLTTYGVVSLVAAPFIAHFADKTPNRKIPLLLSLAACASGTILVACAPTVWLLMVGEIFQSLASCSVWIVAQATLVDNISENNKGKVLGTAMSFITTGIFAGPMVSGVLLQLLGYWPAWSAALLLLSVDILARLLMIENRPRITNQTQPTDEQTALLPEIPESDDSDSNPTGPVSHHGFYRIMLSNLRVLAGLFNTLFLSMVLAAFDTTLPLHVRAVFGWDSLPVGLLFFSLQVPSIIFGPAIGHLRDRTGLRGTTTVGCALMVPLLWLLGVPGKELPWGKLEGRDGEAVYITAIIGLGFALALTRGAGSIQMLAVLHELEKKNPTMFGPYGGNSRLAGLTELPFNVGLIAGPLLSGSISEVLGYYWTNTGLAVIAVAVTVSSYVYFTDEPKSETGSEREGEAA
ncbi:major facilitator superfamily domain-containing protein [Aspergillus karnatakaensis]|uniref:major facilitator superfamily domain-containing protein n=1 Tax=Aspergillus karnatakaensis TaxID=1810916 RepID=UPI003CCE0D81